MTSFSFKQHHPSKWPLRNWVGFLFLICLGHYCFCLSRVSESLERIILERNPMMLDIPWKISEQPPDRVGMVTCLADRTSVLDVLVLAQSIQEDFWDTDGLIWEIYHPHTLSRFLQGHLETSFPFVTVVAVDNKNNPCLTRALQTTYLKHVFVVPPSIQFLRNPKQLLEQVQENQKEHCQNSQKKFVSFADRSKLVEFPEGLCVVQIPRRPSAPILHKSPNRTIHVATMEGPPARAAWLQMDPSYQKWVGVNDFHSEPFAQHSSSINSLLQQHWRRQGEARRLVLMDRPVKWVAFDAGFHADDSSTLNTLAAAKRSLQAGAGIINVDIALTADRQLVAVHNDKSITPAQFPQSQLTTSIANLQASEALRLTNPCLPPDIVRRSLLPNPYQRYHCQPEPVSLASEFMRMVQLHDQKQQNSQPTEMILDLKAPKVALQVEQARILAQTHVRQPSLAVRFFSVFGEEDRLAATVFPEEALHALKTDATLEGIGYYVNVPSSLACLQLAGWIHNHHSFRNKRLQGCYVILDHSKISQSWTEFTQKYQVNTSSVPAPVAPRPKLICDVPRKQSFRDPSLWAKEYNHCLSEGFDYIHDPFPPPSHADTDRLPMLSSIPNFHDKVQEFTLKNLRPMAPNGATIQFGYGSATDWDSNQQFQWYQGITPMDAANVTAKMTLPQHNFRCVTKVLTVLLFLKFQEMGKLSLDDLVVDGDNHTHAMTYRQVFSNTGGFNDTRIGEDFIYSNGLWPPIPSAFERQTGIRFVDAVKQYVIEPMGLEGSYDETNVTIPPYAGRGYNGEPEDLIVIGGLLAGRGVSPKTRRQIVSPESVEIMLSDSIVTPVLAESFAKEAMVKEMDRVYNRTGGFPMGFVDGYGMGLWRVNGWRHTAQGLPIQGWLAQGTCMVYFDTTGLVFSFFPLRPFSASLVRNYAKMIRDLGDYLVGREEVPAPVQKPLRLIHRNRDEIRDRRKRDRGRQRNQTMAK